MGKQIRNCHPSRPRRKCLPGENIHSDVCYLPCKSWHGFKYMVVFKDEASAYRMVYFISTLDQVKEAIRMMVTRVKLETDRSVKVFRSDNGTEYTNKDVKTFL